MTLPSLITLKKRSEFQRVARSPHKHIGRFCVLQASPRVFSDHPFQKASPLSPASFRFGFIVTRKMGGAVQRNRIRRRFKASIQAYLKHADTHQIPLDIVIIARSASDTLPFHILSENIFKSLTQLHASFILKKCA